jgi:hypothetical protein
MAAAVLTSSVGAIAAMSLALWRNYRREPADSVSLAPDR